MNNSNTKFPEVGSWWVREWKENDELVEPWQRLLRVFRINPEKNICGEQEVWLESMHGSGGWCTPHEFFEGHRPALRSDMDTFIKNTRRWIVKEHSKQIADSMEELLTHTADLDAFVERARKEIIEPSS